MGFISLTREHFRAFIPYDGLPISWYVIVAFADRVIAGPTKHSLAAARGLPSSIRAAVSLTT
jgi:hypothetical protein